MTRRRVAVFTGNRAEYGSSIRFSGRYHADPRSESYRYLAGARISKKISARRWRRSKLTAFRCYAAGRRSDGRRYAVCDAAQAIGSAVFALSAILAELRPDFLVVYADRYEGFAAMITGTQMNIPTAHIEGGDSPKAARSTIPFVTP